MDLDVIRCLWISQLLFRDSASVYYWLSDDNDMRTWR
jgi:hypothetical protein